MPAWPLSDKKFAVNSYQETALVDPSIRTTMDSGPPKARARFTRVPKKFDGMIDTLSSDQIETLIDFYEDDCAMGSLNFTWTHPRTGAACTFMWLKYPEVSTANSPIVFNASLSLLLIP